MATALFASLTLHFWAPFSGAGPVLFAKTALTVTLLTTVVWIVVTMLTPPEPPDVLLRFYRKVRPHVGGWEPVAAQAPDVPRTRDLGANLLAWVLGCAMVYAALFGVGKLLFQHYALGAALLVLAAACAWLLAKELARLGWGAGSLARE